MSTPAPAMSGGISDAELVARLQGGDLAAFEPLMRRHNQKLYRAARSILKDDGEAEDAVQDGYLHAYRALDSFRREANLATWLMRIVVNEALRRVRRRRTRAEVIRLGGEGAVDVESALESAADPGTSSYPEQSAMRADTRRVLETKIDELPDAFRTVFVLRSIEEMSIPEIAACLDIPEPTVRTRYFRARSLLRESLSRDIDMAIEGAFGFAGERCDRIVRRSLARCADEGSIKPPGSKSS